MFKMAQGVSAAKTTSYLASKHVRTVAWPPRSPDLNPIETLWAVMQPRVAQKSPANFEELRDAVQEVWNELDVNTVNSLVESFDVRLQQCIEARGRMTAN